MPESSHLILSSEQAFVVPDGEIARGVSADARANWSLRLRTCHGGRSHGVHVLELDNGHMTIDVLPTRGMGIWRVRRGTKTLGWQAPAREPVHPSMVPLMEPSGLGWLDGFNELLCRCGLESNGPPEFDDAGRLLRPLHGRVSNTPAHRVDLLVDAERNELTLRGTVDEGRFHFQNLRLTASITTPIGSSEFSWSDEVENIGGRDATMQMLYHFNIGQPLLRPGASIAAPVHEVAPKTPVAAQAGVQRWNVVPAPTPGSDEQVYCLDLRADDAGHTCVLVTGLSDDEAVSLRFNKLALPCFTVWRNTPAECDGYVLGIEPGTNFPNPRRFEQSRARVVTLRPGEKWKAAVSATWHASSQSIAECERAIGALQGSTSPTLSPSPKPDWSAP